MSSAFAQAISGPDAVTWSARVVDLTDGETLWEHDAGRVLKAASVGKVFLLAEVARGFEAGTLNREEVVEAAAEDRVADSGILHLLANQNLRMDDLCTLIGAVSDNMATNILLRRLGLEEVQNATRDLGYLDSGLRDVVRLNRPQDDPLTLSVGNAAELSNFVARLDEGTVHSPGVCEQVRRWLSANTDMSMVAGAFGLDPLAHAEPDHGFALWNKTGTISDARIEIGCAECIVSGRKVGYAVLANWTWGQDHREPVLAAMHRVGRAIRRHLED
jgi:beta-lactamase class A